jgi:hypothetical protein
MAGLDLKNNNFSYWGDYTTPGAAIGESTLIMPYIDPSESMYVTGSPNFRGFLGPSSIDSLGPYGTTNLKTSSNSAYLTPKGGDIIGYSPTTYNANSDGAYTVDTPMYGPDYSTATDIQNLFNKINNDPGAGLGLKTPSDAIWKGGLFNTDWLDNNAAGWKDKYNYSLIPAGTQNMWAFDGNTVSPTQMSQNTFIPLPPKSDGGLFGGGDFMSFLPGLIALATTGQPWGLIGSIAGQATGNPAIGLLASLAGGYFGSPTGGWNADGVWEGALAPGSEYAAGSAPWELGSYNPDSFLPGGGFTPDQWGMGVDGLGNLVDNLGEITTYLDNSGRLGALAGMSDMAADRIVNSIMPDLRIPDVGNPGGFVDQAFGNGSDLYNVPDPFDPGPEQGYFDDAIQSSDMYRNPRNPLWDKVHDTTGNADLASIITKGKTMFAPTNQGGWGLRPNDLGKALMSLKSYGTAKDAYGDAMGRMNSLYNMAMSTADPHAQTRAWGQQGLQNLQSSLENDPTYRAHMAEAEQGARRMMALRGQTGSGDAPARMARAIQAGGAPYKQQLMDNYLRAASLGDGRSATASAFSGPLANLAIQSRMAPEGYLGSAIKYGLSGLGLGNNESPIQSWLKSFVES